MLIDCETCRVRDVGCADCVVSLFLDTTPVVELDDSERSALDALAGGGLAPPLRLVPVARSERQQGGGLAEAG